MSQNWRSCVSLSIRVLACIHGLVPCASSDVYGLQRQTDEKVAVAFLAVICGKMDYRSKICQFARISSPKFGDLSNFEQEFSALFCTCLRLDCARDFEIRVYMYTLCGRIYCVKGKLIFELSIQLKQVCRKL